MFTQTLWVGDGHLRLYFSFLCWLTPSISLEISFKILLGTKYNGGSGTVITVTNIATVIKENFSTITFHNNSNTTKLTYHWRFWRKKRKKRKFQNMLSFMELNLSDGLLLNQIFIIPKIGRKLFQFRQLHEEWDDLEKCFYYQLCTVTWKKKNPPKKLYQKSLKALSE